MKKSKYLEAQDTLNKYEAKSMHGQLPIVWKYSFFKIISKFVSFLRIPYQPMHEGLTSLRWPTSLNNFLRFSNEVMLIAICKKK